MVMYLVRNVEAMPIPESRAIEETLILLAKLGEIPTILPIRKPQCRYQLIGWTEKICRIIYMTSKEVQMLANK